MERLEGVLEESRRPDGLAAERPRSIPGASQRIRGGVPLPAELKLEHRKSP